MNKEKRELERQWLAIVLANSKSLEKGAKAKAVKSNAVKSSKIPQLIIPADRDSRVFKSLDTGSGNTAVKSIMQYTGTQMLGISTMHKSNSVPVFSKEEAQAITKMRR